MSSQLTALRSLFYLNIYQCSLSQLPDLSEMENLQSIDIQHNALSQLIGLNNPNFLGLQYNNFTDLPVLGSNENLQFLLMSGNPLKHIMRIGSFVNLYNFDVSYTPITLIPPTIEKLQALEYMSISFSKVTYLPKNILKLNKLRYFDAQGGLFEKNELEIIKAEFNKTLPNCNLYV